MQRSQIVGFALTALVLVPVLSGAQTLPYEYSTFVDTDNNSATGCTVVVGADQFSGAEFAVTMVVDPASQREAGAPVLGEHDVQDDQVGTSLVHARDA